ncbi:shTK domain protein [Ostertagia ostertagi]
MVDSFAVNGAESDSSSSADEAVGGTSPSILIPTDERSTTDLTSIDEQDEDDYESYEDENEQEQEDDRDKDEGGEEVEDEDSTVPSVTEEGKEEEEGKDSTTTSTTISTGGSSAETDTFETTDEDGEDTTPTATTTLARLESTLTTMTEATTRNTPPTTSRPCFDKINPNTGRSDCPFRRNLCMEGRYIQLMREQCPRTCGFCGLRRVQKAEPGVSCSISHSYATSSEVLNFQIDACNDLINPRTGRSDCPNRRPLCRNNVYQKLMTEQCPRTCGFCNTRFVRSATQTQKGGYKNTAQRTDDC